ncbi:MAG: FecR domain-containing protein [bacterium]
MEQKIDPETLTSRRFFLAEGTRLFTMAGVGGALISGLGVTDEASAQGWRSLFRRTPEGGHGRVKKVQGEATAAGRPLKVGDRVESGEEIRVGKQGTMILSLADNTIFRINGEAKFQVHTSQRRRTGFFRLLLGSILTVMPRRNRYLVQMPSASIGIKGTIFFHQIYGEEEFFASDYGGKIVALPEGISEYFCLCNGLADFLKTDEDKAFFSDVSKYHNSYYIDPKNSKILVKAPQLNHTDDDILELIEFQEEPKHDSRWIGDYRATYKPDPAP